MGSCGDRLGRDAVVNTKLCDLLNIDVPVIQGGMAWVSTGKLAAAVSEAGGLGVIGAGSMPPELLRQEIAKARAGTDRPFGVNVMLLNEFAAEHVELLVEERIPVVTTGAGSPGAVIERMRPEGIVVIPVVASVALARRVEKMGADAVIAEGTEAGGHIGETTTLVLVPQVVDTVSIPVIAAGGIADGRGLAAALALGAVGVQIGTRFICAEECEVHKEYKERVVAAGDRDTIVTGRALGHPVRVLRNRLAREFVEREREMALEGLEELGMGKLRMAALEGDVEWGSVMAGQSAALVRRVEPAAAIVAGIIKEAEEILLKKAAELDGG